MTIQRQYVLPNCSLVLEGLSADASNVLSILANAEFKIVGLEKPLAGGSEFFRALVDAIGAYCQRLLSGLDHPDHISSQSSLVSVEPDEGQYHRLLIKPDVLEDLADSSEKSAPQTIRLSTVQLFDMAEAIDQFHADAQTLPDFSVNLAPLPRKYVRASEPLAQRAIPPLLGFGTLAVAALGLFFLPVPELVEPEALEQQTTSALEETLGNEPATDNPDETEPEAAENAAAGSEAEATESSPLINTAITDSTQLEALQQQVQQQLSSSSVGSEDSPFEQPLRYQISVAENGDIVGYNPLDEVSLENIDTTPLPSLTYIPVNNAAVGPMAQFDVTFVPDGTVEVVSDQVVTPTAVPPATVNPDAEASESIESVTPESITPEVESSDAAGEKVVPSEASGEGADTTEEASTASQTNADAADSDIKTSATAGKLENFIATPIRDVDRIYELNQGLRRTIIDNRDSDWSGPDIRYRVRLDEEGNITGYEADDAAAEQYADELKFSNLVKTVPAENPQLDFLVVISAANVVEVNPWDGWP
ncbi:DUF4335 domain-containing protein [Leptothoe spongobia]|uniref:DUF4335 domain-containing protein n=1 Tax=Leptothoe spongobia TAU-MAC 1115 TaxID=1967444 RepID=A0A947DFI4_9CYAN|nr:DUF4335 domain-containing protein [Leptothoe spongobia]MBT9316097.1 DUF4335 domain-containing protein [Leptothoe spongobia TAU-MAC 1115]